MAVGERYIHVVVVAHSPRIRANADRIGHTCSPLTAPRYARVALALPGSGNHKVEPYMKGVVAKA